MIPYILLGDEVLFFINEALVSLLFFDVPQHIEEKTNTGNLRKQHFHSDHTGSFFDPFTSFIHFQKNFLVNIQL